MTSTQPRQSRAGSLAEPTRPAGWPGRPRRLQVGPVGLYEAAVLAIRALAHAWQHQPDWQLAASQLLDLAFERLVSPEPSEIDPDTLAAASAS